MAQVGYPILVYRDCACGARFEVPRNRLGQLTTRRLCPTCRAVSSRDRAMWGRPALPLDGPLCADCGALSAMVGGLTPAGLCSSCQAWAVKATARDALLTAGYVLSGVGWVRAS